MSDSKVPLIFISGLFLFLFPLPTMSYGLFRRKHVLRIVYVILFSFRFSSTSSGL
jgi:hypothetical protein